MAKYKVSVDADKCIGCGACKGASDNFDMDGDKAKPKKAEVADPAESQKAIDVCPVEAIKIQKMA